MKRKTSWEAILQNLCVGAGQILLNYFHKPHQIESKPGAGIVTEADKAAERYLVKEILRK